MRYCLLIVLAAACGAPAKRPTPTPAPAHYVFRQRHATRITTFELSFDGDRATLVETDGRAAHTYRGTRHGAELALTTDDMQPLALHCERRAIEAAAPGDDCNAARDRHADALVCSAPGQTGGGGDADADDELVFAPAPGFEWLEAACGGGLRQLP
ncbi:MAG TPA: hypothetical protein VH143_34630 [Kofleriaceae bacterium]|nr:hypothetical protein [Kofleriaceae bacterium]